MPPRTAILAVSLLRAVAGLCAIARPPVGEMLNRLNPVTLAYVGDSIFEAAARERLMWPPSKINDLSSRVQALACAEGQHELLARVVDEFGLSEEEMEWARRGRNASGRGPRRLKPQVYRDSTAFETLVGFLHLTDPERLRALLQFVFETAEATPVGGGGGDDASSDAGGST